MQIPSLINRGRNGFNMTPMIDVVFLLIIFFLVASHLSDQDTQIELELPSAESSVPQDATNSNRVTLNVPVEGQIVFSGDEISLKQLPKLVNSLKENYGEDVEVRVRSSRRVTYETIAPILRECALAGIWNVTFAVYKKQNE